MLALVMDGGPYKRPWEEMRSSSYHEPQVSQATAADSVTSTTTPTSNSYRAVSPSGQTLPPIFTALEQPLSFSGKDSPSTTSENYGVSLPVLRDSIYEGRGAKRPKTQANYTFKTRSRDQSPDRDHHLNASVSLKMASAVPLTVHVTILSEEQEH